MRDGNDEQDARLLADAADATDLRRGAVEGFSMRVGGTPVRWRREAGDIYAAARGRTTISFAAGRPELTVDVPISLASPTPLFANSFERFDATHWLANLGIRLIARLNLETGDQLMVATNQSFLRFQARSTPAHDGRTLAMFAAVVQALPRPAVTETIVRLPGAVGVLDAFVDAYAISDDAERAEVVASASDADLQTLWQAVEPLLPTIHKLLEDSAVDPGTMAAGHLALVAVEAQLELERRTENGAR